MVPFVTGGEPAPEPLPGHTRAPDGGVLADGGSQAGGGDSRLLKVASPAAGGGTSAAPRGNSEPTILADFHPVRRAVDAATPRVGAGGADRQRRRRERGAETQAGQVRSPVAASELETDVGVGGGRCQALLKATSSVPCIK